jgi:hypothetical protein
MASSRRLSSEESVSKSSGGMLGKGQVCMEEHSTQKQQAVWVLAIDLGLNEWGDGLGPTKVTRLIPLRQRLLMLPTTSR